MINDKQRREAARGIRQFLSVSQNKRAWDNDGLQTVGRLVGTSVGENILVRLADLIDRPTCTVVSVMFRDDCDEYEVELSCGDSVRWLGSAEDLAFCPSCGRVALLDAEWTLHTRQRDELSSCDMGGER